MDRAAALFSRRGYSATIITEVCDVVGLARGALHPYIGSKEELLVEIQSAVLVPLLRAGSRIAAPATMRLLFEVLLNAMAERLDHIKVSEHDYRQLSEPCRSTVVAQRHQFEAVMAGELRDVDLRLGMLQFLITYNHTYRANRSNSRLVYLPRDPRTCWAGKGMSGLHRHGLVPTIRGLTSCHAREPGSRPDSARSRRCRHRCGLQRSRRLQPGQVSAVLLIHMHARGRCGNSYDSSAWAIFRVVSIAQEPKYGTRLLSKRLLGMDIATAPSGRSSALRITAPTAHTCGRHHEEALTE